MSTHILLHTRRNMASYYERLARMPCLGWIYGVRGNWIPVCSTRDHDALQSCTFQTDFGSLLNASDLMWYHVVVELELLPIFVDIMGRTIAQTNIRMRWAADVVIDGDPWIVYA